WPAPRTASATTPRRGKAPGPRPWSAGAPCGAPAAAEPRVSDAARRSAERAASAGDPAAAVRALAARLRAGELSEERLRLAATLGHAGACALLGVAPPDEDALLLGL